MPLDVEGDFTHVIRSFNRGLVTRIDDREAPQDSLADVVGFNLSRKWGRLVRDNGYSKYFGDGIMPENLVTVHGLHSFNIEVLNQDFVVLFGADSNGNAGFWMRPYFDTGTESVVDAWTNLGELIPAVVVSTEIIDNLTHLAVSGISDPDMYIGFVVINRTSGEYALITGVDDTGRFILETTYLGWIATQNLYICRSQIVESLEGIALGSNPWFMANDYHQTESIGWSPDSVSVRDPLFIEYVHRSLFYHSQTNSWLRSLNTLSMYGSPARYEKLSELGIVIEAQSAFPSLNSVPVSVVSKTSGWKDQDGTEASSNLVAAVDDGRVIDKSTYITCPNSGSSPSIIFQLDDINLPASGYVRVYVAAQSRRDVEWMFQFAEGDKVQESSYMFDDRDYETSLTCGIEDHNFTSPSGPFQVRIIVKPTGSPDIAIKIYNVFVVIEDTSGTSGITTLRTAYVPLFNDYMLGRPILQTHKVSSGIDATWLPRVSIDFGLMDKRLTGLFIFQDDTSAKINIDQFRSSYYFDFTGDGPNESNSAWTTIKEYVESAGEFQSTDLSGTVVVVADATSGAIMTGMSTSFLTDLLPGDKVILQHNIPLGTQITADVTRVVSDTVAYVSTNLIGYFPPTGVATITRLRRNKIVPFVPGVDNQGVALVKVNRGDGYIGAETLKNFLGYAIVDKVPDCNVKWRFQIAATAKENSQIFVDESDDVLRGSYYDGGGIHNPFIYPNISMDTAYNPLRISLAAKGKLLGIVGQYGKLYAYKRTSIEIINAASGENDRLEADVIAPKSIVATSYGILHLGKYNVYLLPLDGSYPQTIAEQIQTDLLNMTDEDKAAAIGEENKALGIYILSFPGGVQYCYHFAMKAWWKREFAHTPAAFTRLSDDTFLMAPVDASRIVRYPDFDVYGDDDSWTDWLIRTQWIRLTGQSDLQTTLRSIGIDFQGTYVYRIDVYVDRQEDVPFDTLYSPSRNEIANTEGTRSYSHPIRVPNSISEFQLVIRPLESLKGDTISGPVLDPRFDIMEIRIYGEITTIGHEY